VTCPDGESLGYVETLVVRTPLTLHTIEKHSLHF
jgi:hypothetical protein